MHYSRRHFLKRAGYTSSGLLVLSQLPFCTSAEQGGQEETSADTITNGDASANEAQPKVAELKISLAQWSLHKTIFDKKMDNLDFPEVAKTKFGIEAIEFVNQFFADKAEDAEYMKELGQRVQDQGVTPLLIMIDREGNLGDTDEAKRKEAVENHYKWVEAAKGLGCHSIRVNAAGQGTAEEVSAAAIQGLGSLCEFAKPMDMNVIVENHGGYSSNGEWLSNVINQVGMDNCGTLPDFGNFCIERGEDGCANEYDRYKGMEEILPFAKGVSAKSNVFNEAGEESNIDFTRMLQLVRAAGFEGYVGIEYEGSELSEEEGILKTKALLEKVIQETAQA